VHGLDLEAISDAQIAELQDLMFRERLVVIKGQDLDEESYIAFAHRFGTPVPYLQTNYHHPKYPLIFVSSNVRGEDGQRMGVPRTGGYWHSDTSFELEPKTLTMLLPRVLPQTAGRSTRFIDMGEVTRNMPEALLRELEGKAFVHSGRFRYKVRAEDAGLDITELLAMIDHHAPPVEHPALITHPHTRERIVYGSRGFVIGVAGAGASDSERILDALFDFAESPRFVREVEWHVGDLIVWDNRSLQHSSGRKRAPAERIHDALTTEEKTMMFRITLRDQYPLYEKEAA
jgi:taurine dioxygenase